VRLVTVAAGRASASTQRSDAAGERRVGSSAFSRLQSLQRNERRRADGKRAQWRQTARRVPALRSIADNAAGAAVLIRTRDAVVTRAASWRLNTHTNTHNNHQASDKLGTSRKRQCSNERLAWSWPTSLAPKQVIWLPEFEVLVPGGEIAHVKESPAAISTKTPGGACSCRSWLLPKQNIVQSPRIAQT
jgi:hypothetical protein